MDHGNCLIFMIFILVAAIPSPSSVFSTKVMPSKNSYIFLLISENAEIELEEGNVLPRSFIGFPNQIPIGGNS